MSRKRKRNAPESVIEGTTKRPKLFRSRNDKNEIVRDHVLSQYYVEVLTLRGYLLAKLPISSKTRRKKIQSVGRSVQLPDESKGKGLYEDEALARHLDQTLVGVLERGILQSDERLKQRISFSQRLDSADSTTLSDLGNGAFSQSEVRNSLTLYALLGKSVLGYQVR